MEKRPRGEKAPPPAGGGRVLIDASNVAHSTEGGEAKLRNIRLAMDKLSAEGFQPTIVADAALRHQIDDKAAYEQLIESGVVKQAPAGTDADYFILSFAREMDARILTNDRFRDRAVEFADERDKVIRYMIVDDAMVLEMRGKRRSRGQSNGGQPNRGQSNRGQSGGRGSRSRRPRGR